MVSLDRSPTMSVSSAFKILALGPNPAFQRVVRFDSPITLGGINRAAAVDTYVGGKGQGAAMAANRFAQAAALLSHIFSAVIQASTSRPRCLRAE